jgi:hypothetical protein
LLNFVPYKEDEVRDMGVIEFVASIVANGVPDGKIDLFFLGIAVVCVALLI